MRVVVQRVSGAEVVTEAGKIASIGKGLLLLLGVESSDSDEDVEWLAGKIARLRIFNDDRGIMNLSVSETGGSMIVVSQFTLHASTKKGNRPSYIRAANPEQAIPLYESLVSRLRELSGCRVETGQFGAAMQVSLINEGPVTIVIDTKNKE